MINELVKLSNHLDELGLTKEANFLDAVTERLSLKKSAQDALGAPSNLSLEARVKRLEDLLEGRLARAEQRGGLLERRIEALERIGSKHEGHAHRTPALDRAEKLRERQ